MELHEQFLKITAYDVARLHVLEVVPSALVPRAQVGGVPRQGSRPDLAARPRHDVHDLGDFYFDTDLPQGMDDPIDQLGTSPLGP